MNNETVTRVHWSFWLVSAFALIWNVMGSINFVMQMNAEIVASFPETHRAIIEGRPLWATAGFALAVFGGALGGLLLLLRKRIAIQLFIASLLGAIVTMIHTINIARSTIEFSTSEIVIMILSPLIVGALFIWYSMFAKGWGWIR